jgi:putative selenium metabolism protein SsnA
MEGGAPVRLLCNGTVVTGGETPAVFADGAVAWRNENIVDVGPGDEVAARWPDADRLDARGGLILPGLVNLHHHFYSAFARGLATPRPPADFAEVLELLWWRLDRALTLETVRVSAQLAALDCIRWGCTTVFDHHASPRCLRGSLQEIAHVVDEAGLSAVLCYEVSDRNGREEATAGLVENLYLIDATRNHPRIRGTLGLHASFTLSEATLDEAASHRPDGIGCHIHLAEDPLDFQASELSYGAAPLDRLRERGLVDGRSLLVHGVHLTSAGLAVVAEHGATLVHCPESNANNGVGRLDVERAAAAGCTVGLGTDGMSSSMLRALRAAYLTQRDLRRDPRAGFTVHPGLLSTNTLVARRFLDRPLLGELAVDAPADLCVVDDRPPTPVTPDNVFAHLVYGAAESPVRHTIANGQVLFEDFEHRTLDPQEIAAAARDIAPEVWRRFEAIGGPGPQGEAG